MTAAWDEFRRGIPNRFLLPLDVYMFTASFVPFEPVQEELIEISNKITTTVVEAIQASPDPNLQALRRLDSEGSLFRIGYGDPTYDFQVQLDDNAITIAKNKFSLEDLVVTIPLIEYVAKQLFSVAGENSLSQHVFFRRAFRANHHFTQKISLGPRLSDENVTPTNIEVMKFFSNFSDESAVSWLQPERILRNDFTLSMDKIFDDRMANVWIRVEAPWNSSQRDLTISLDFRRGDSPGTKFEAEDFFEHRDVISLFYRDYIIQRLFKNIFHDTSVLPAIWS